LDIYLDNAATSRRKPETVYAAVDAFMRNVGASPARSVHGYGIEASRIVESAREEVSGLLGVSDSSRLVLTSGCTESLNIAILGMLKHGDHVIVSGLEHNSVMRPLTALAHRRSVGTTRLPVTSAGTTDPTCVETSILPTTAMIISTHASNVTGAIQPIAEIGGIARTHDIPFLLDAAQTVGHVPVDLGSLPVDMCAFSGHKGLMGPQGTGALYIRKGIYPAPLMYGGTGSASTEETQPPVLPDMYESGTPNTPGIAGLLAAAKFLRKTTIAAIHAHLESIGVAFIAGLKEIGEVTLYGPGTMLLNSGVFSFTVANRDPGELAEKLERKHGIMTRVGLHCAPSAHKSIGTFPAGTVRASIGYYTTKNDVEVFLRALKEVVRA